MSDRIIVTRHAAAVEFIRQQRPEFADAPVFSEVSAEDVRGKVVAGNLPLHLAAEAETVFAIAFTGPPPRGREYTLADMRAAGAHLVALKVTKVAK